MRNIYIRLKFEYRQSSYIQLIRTIRETFALGLKEAKDYVDVLREGGLICVPFWGDSDEITNDLDNSGMFVYSFNDEPLVEFGRSSYRVSRDRTMYGSTGTGKIHAIKALRYAMGWGLKESKDFMDEMWGYEHTPKDISINIDLFPDQVVSLRDADFTVVSNTSFGFSPEEERLFII